MKLRPLPSATVKVNASNLAWITMTIRGQAAPPPVNIGRGEADLRRFLKDSKPFLVVK